MGGFFEGGAEGKGRGVVHDLDDSKGGWFHADKAWGCFVLVWQAGDRGGRGFIRRVV